MVRDLRPGAVEWHHRRGNSTRGEVIAHMVKSGDGRGGSSPSAVPGRSPAPDQGPAHPVVERVDTRSISLSAYRGLIRPDLYARIMARAKALRGVRVVTVSATPLGGGVAEMLQSLVPLMQGCGVRADWYVLSASPAFFDVTKK